MKKPEIRPLLKQELLDLGINEELADTLLRYAEEKGDELRLLRLKRAAEYDG